MIQRAEQFFSPRRLKLLTLVYLRLTCLSVLGLAPLKFPAGRTKASGPHLRNGGEAREKRIGRDPVPGAGAL